MKMKILYIVFIGLLLTLLAYRYFIVDTAVPLVEVEDTIENLAPQAGLPPNVEAKRQAIFAAANSRDYTQLASETGENFYYSYGGAYEGGFVGYMMLSEKDEGESAFDIIPVLLKLPYAIQGDLYTWPSVFTVAPSDWTETDIAMMKTFLTDEEIQRYRDFGGYIYYRLGITALGNWSFYLAGD